MGGGSRTGTSMIRFLITALGAYAGHKFAKRNRVAGAALGATGGFLFADQVFAGKAVELPTVPPDQLPGESTQGLGFFWIWAKDYYTVWTGSKYLPARYLTRSAATDWYLDSKEKYWDQSTRLLKKVDGLWVKQA